MDAGRPDGAPLADRRDGAPAVPDVSVIVPHYQDFARLDLCLAALSAQAFAGTHEIIVADNASPDGPDRVRAAVDGRATVVFQPDKGAGLARNRGVASARGRFLAFTDADCLPASDWLAAGIAALSRDAANSPPDIIVGGAVEVATGSPRSAAEAFETVFAFNNAAYIRHKGFSVTANLFVPTTTFHRVGPFRAGVSEDVEWCRRAVAAGARLVYAADAIVGHPARRDWHELAHKWQRLARETYELDRASGMSAAWWLARTWLMLLETPRGLVRVARSRRLTGLDERLGAAGVLIRLRLYRFVLNHRLAMA